MGPAESTFPHPQEWRLEGVDKPLDKVTVKDMTRAITGRATVTPSCVAAWAKRIGALPSDIGNRYNLQLLTPRDWSSHFKNVLHRAMRVKGNEEGNEACRVCKHERENLEHFALCERTGELFVAFARLVARLIPDGETADYHDWPAVAKTRFALFALLPGDKSLANGWLNFHLLLWKHIIHHLTVMETEGAAYAPHTIWKAAWIRLEKKALAKQVTLQAIHRRADSRGDLPPKLSKNTRLLAPLGAFDDEGKLEWDERFKEAVCALSKPPAKKTRTIAILR